MENVERTVAVRNCRDEAIRGRAGTRTPNQPVGGNYIARIKHPSTGRAVATVKYNRPIEQYGRGGRHQPRLSRDAPAGLTSLRFGRDARHPQAACRR